MNQTSRLLVMIVVLVALAQAQAKTPSAPSGASKAEVSVDPATYVIGAQDVLQINVWKEPDMSATAVPVRPDGKISLPLLGDIQAAGLTPTKLAEAIGQQGKKYVQDPQVTVVVTAINSQRIYLLGEVGHAGPIAMLPEMTVLQAIASAGGLSQYANARKIYVLRMESGVQQHIPFNYKQALKGDPKQNIQLKPGDTIVVP